MMEVRAEVDEVQMDVFVSPEVKGDYRRGGYDIHEPGWVCSWFKLFFVFGMVSKGSRAKM